MREVVIRRDLLVKRWRRFHMPVLVGGRVFLIVSGLFEREGDGGAAAFAPLRERRRLSAWDGCALLFGPSGEDT